MARYLILIERGENNYGAYVPDVPGVIAVGDTVEEVTREMREALEFHLEGLALEGYPIPQPTHTAAYVDVDLPSPSVMPKP
ncbi:MAG TPA: type II toxin-antitoxin system HicB family antitoxin [Ktedonobacterales bacterium]|nr:type II toxin-antitoxin system HicB family antitoxin [Ktedonobacterales bacterium]